MGDCSQTFGMLPWKTEKVCCLFETPGHCLEKSGCVWPLGSLVVVVGGCCELGSSKPTLR